MTRRPVSPAQVVLGFVDPADEPPVRRQYAEDPLFREEVRRLERATAMLEGLDRHAWRPETPPPLAAFTTTTTNRQSRRRWRLAVPAVLATGAAVAAVTVLGGSEPPSAGRSIALRALGEVPGTATLTVSDREAQLSGAGLPPSGPHDYYEAWLADRSGRMIPMGTFRVDARGRVDARMPVAVRLADYELVDVSLEPDDGDPAHSSHSVLRGRL